ncbi:MAG: hypothetical protein JXA77_16780 [Bacteroidales bacterium]|nr:hypothetical protein [Bacteroidales bacterium]MBN2819356.1 hypothetical protein [Bacteroidales bacterium]
MNFEEGLKKFYKFIDKDLVLTFEYFKLEQIATKTYLLKEGKILDKIGFVKSGMFRSFFIDSDANDITTHFFLPGTVLISIDTFLEKHSQVLLPRGFLVETRLLNASILLVNRLVLM